MDFKKWLTSIWFLALLIAIPVILILPSVFEKYNVDLVEEEKVPESDFTTKVYFEDIDSDGKMERFETFSREPDKKTLSFHYFRSHEGMVDQINFPVKFNIETRALYFADTNNDGHKEIFTFSYSSDSLYLNWLNVTPEVGNIYSIPICAINYYSDSLINYAIGKIHCVDLDLDGKKELVFAVNGGYSYSPRQIFKVDIENRTVEKSENSGSVNYNLQFSDLNGDGKLEIIADGATAPVRDWFNLPYNKPAPYLKIFNSSLSYFTTPIQFFEGIQTDVFSYVIQENGSKKIISTVLSNSAECPSFRAYKINLKGEKTDSLVYKINGGKGRCKYVFRNENGNFVTQTEPGEFLEYSTNLEVINLIKTNIHENLGLVVNSDINDDGTNELLFLNLNSKTIYLFSDRFKWHISIPFDEAVSAAERNIRLKNNRFYLTSDKGYYIYSFKSNPYYLLRFPGYLLVYFISVLILLLFQRLIEMRLKEKYELQNQVRELQLKTFRNQLNPHFIFNTFNGVASVLKKGDSETAYKVFMRFSKMVRHILDNFDNDFLSLDKELELVENYIELQKFRFKELFEYEIRIEDKTLRNFIVPRMIVQIRVENAIKHGLIPKGGGGLLTIEIKSVDNNLEIVIEDNGIGRASASVNSTDSNGIGIKTIEGLVDFINLGHKQKVTQQTIDLVDENGIAAGTRVVVIIPLKLKAD